MDSAGFFSSGTCQEQYPVGADSEDVSNWELVGFSMIIVTPSTTL